MHMVYQLAFFLSGTMFKPEKYETPNYSYGSMQTSSIPTWRVLLQNPSSKYLTQIPPMNSLTKSQQNQQ